MHATAVQSDPGSCLMPSLQHATVADAMHPGLLSCDPGASSIEVARMMVTHHVHCVAVMGFPLDRAGESSFWGIISDVDLLDGSLGNDGESTAEGLARQVVISVKATAPLRAAAELMLKHGVSHLLVIDPDTRQPVGILSTLDVAGVLTWGEA
jgi:CBS domain-containing protein